MDRSTTVTRRALIAALAAVVVMATVPTGAIAVEGGQTGDPHPSTDAPPGMAAAPVDLDGGVVVAAAGNGTNATVELTYTLARATESGRLVVNASVTVPPSIDSLILSLPANATVRAVDRVEQTGADNYATTAATARIVYATPIGHESRFGTVGVDTGEWAFLGHDEYWAPNVSTPGATPAFENWTRVEGQGIGEDFLFFGDYRVVSIDGAATDIEIVVPDAAVPPGPIVYELIAAADHELDVGAYSDRVRGYVAPDPIREGGAADVPDGVVEEVWVGDQPRDLRGRAELIWLHELVHTRQTLSLARNMRWFTEASAEYYSEYLHYRHSDAGFDFFHWEVTARYNGILSDPDRWTTYQLPYDKGAHVLAALDAKIRNESDGTGSLEDVFRRMNRAEGTVNLTRFESMIADVAGTSLDGWIERYVTTPAEPTVPDNRTAFAPVAPELVDYTGSDATIDTDGLRQLVTDWARGTVSTEFLVDGINAWASQRSVP